MRILKGVATIHSDSQSAIHLCKNPVYHEKTKHIDVRYHFIREKVEENSIKLEKVDTEENPFDMATKVVPAGKLQKCLKLLNIGNT